MMFIPVLISIAESILFRASAIEFKHAPTINPPDFVQLIIARPFVDNSSALLARRKRSQCSSLSPLDETTKTALQVKRIRSTTRSTPPFSSRLPFVCSFPFFCFFLFFFLVGVRCANRLALLARVVIPVTRRTCFSHGFAKL